MTNMPAGMSVNITLEEVTLPGILAVPPEAEGLVLFAHGSGSSRLSPRNGFVAMALQQRGMATLLFDLLSEDEDIDYTQRFNIPLLTQRLVYVTRWATDYPTTQGLLLGYFGASTGSAAALYAAAELGSLISAVVSRGGRPDLAEEVLPQVRAATLLIVGGDDEPVLTWNRQAYAKLRCEKRLEVVPGATHLFEERGALESVAGLATEWFYRYLQQPGEIREAG